jgi:DNA-binding response OmpR family regulator
MPRVLLVDDTPEIAELLSWALRDRGHEVLATGFTPGVDDLIVANGADALVLDCSVFEMSASLFDIVRDRPELADLPIVIISDTPEIADEALRRRHARRVLLIPKPFTGSQVARALEEMLAPDASRRP